MRFLRVFPYFFKAFADTDQELAATTIFESDLELLICPRAMLDSRLGYLNLAPVLLQARQILIMLINQLRIRNLIRIDQVQRIKLIGGIHQH